MKLETIALWEMIFTGVSALFTLVLTTIIIIQTSKLHKNQQNLERHIEKNQGELQKKLNQSQIEMQQRQIKLDVYKYRREVYLSLIKVFRFCDSIENAINTVKSIKQSPSNFLQMLIINKKQYVEGNSDFLDILLESKHLFDDIIYEKIKATTEYFNLILSCTAILEYNTKDEDFDFAMQTMKSCIECIEKICEEKNILLQLLEHELNVSNLEK